MEWYTEARVPFLCGKTFCIDYLQPSNLKEHLSSIDPQNSSDSVETFQQKKARLKQQER